MIMREGDQGNCAYLVQSGKVSVYTEKDGKTVELAQLELGEIFGELALVFDEPRTASVKAIEDSNLIILDRAAFKRKLDKSDPTIKAIVGMMKKRITSSNEAVFKKKTDTADLIETVRAIYSNVAAELPRDQQRTFENAVSPKLDEFLNALRAFQERYPKK